MCFPSENGCRERNLAFIVQTVNKPREKQQGNPLRILALDTSTGPASLALVDNGQVIATHEDSEAMRQSQRLVSAVDALVRANGGYEAISAMAATTGPGGFTGIRIALAAARGLALACRAPLLGITTLQTFAWQALADQPQGATAIPYVNAFRNQAYVQVFRRTAQGMEPLTPSQAVDIAEAAAFAPSHMDALRLGNLPAEILRMENYTHFPAPHAQHTALYAARLLTTDAQSALAQHPAEAHYIRPPDAKPQTPLLKGSLLKE